jgi:phosphonate transport system substrate-binding protein
MFRTLVNLGFLLLVMTALIVSLGCGQAPEYKKIDLTNREAEASAPMSGPPAATIRVAIAGVISPIETLKIYEQLVSYIGQELHQSVELVQRSTYAEINDLIKSRYVDFAFVCSFPYVLGYEEFGMELLVVPQVDGETVYRSYIIVPADSNAGSLPDLRERNFAFTDPLSNSGRLAPTYQLYQMGETPDSFFGKYIFTYSHDNSIRAVAEGLVDGAAVDSLVYDYIINREPAIKANVKIIERSEPFGIPPVVVNPTLNQEIKMRIRGLFLNMHQEETGNEILDDLMIDRFVVGNDSAYDTIREMVNTVGW